MKDTEIIQTMTDNEIIKALECCSTEDSADECDVSFGFGREHYTEAVAVIKIDNLVKEMTEGV